MGRLTVPLALLSLVLLRGCHRRPDQSAFTMIDPQAAPTGELVQLRCAKIPHIEAIAVHCWFALWDPDVKQWQRWEVWQSPGGPWEHVRRRTGFSAATDGVGAGPGWVLAEWTGPAAQRIRTVCQHPDAYPWTVTYRYWPGPNSNTYVAWVLRQANVPADLPPAAIGAGYLPVYFVGPDRPIPTPGTSTQPSTEPAYDDD